MITIGSEKTYKALTTVHRYLNDEYSLNMANYVVKMSNEYNRRLKFINKSTNFIPDRNYLLLLVYKDYAKKCDELLTREFQPIYDENFVNHLKNYIYAVYKNTLNNKK